MPITREQVLKQELRRRQLLRELQRRRQLATSPATIAPEPPRMPQVARTPLGRPSAPELPSRITATPISPIEQEEWERAESRHQQRQWLREKISRGEVEPVKPTIWQRFKPHIPRVAGATVGGIVGAATLGPDPTDIITVPAAYTATAKFVGGVIGAGIGGAGGKGYQQAYRMTRPGARPMPLGRLYKEQAKAAGVSMAEEAGGRLVVGAAGKVLAPFKRRLIPGAAKVSKVLAKRKAILTPAQATESRIVDTLEGMAEKSFIGGGKLQRLKRVAQPAALKGYIDDVVKAISKGARKELSPEDVGTLLMDTIEGKRQIFKATARAAYSKVDKLTGIAKVSLSPLKKRAADFGRIAAKRKGVGATQAGDTLLNKILKLDNVITFKEAQSLRSGIIDEISAMSLTKDKAIGMAKQFLKITDDAMSGAAKDLSPEALNAWRIANKFYRYGGARKGVGIIPGMTDFDSKIVRGLVKSLGDNPEKAVKTIFRPGASKQIRIIKKIADKKTWNSLRTAYLQQILTESADVDKVILGKSFLSKLEKIGKPTLKEVFSDQEIRSIRLIGETAHLIGEPVGGSGGMLIQLMQGGAVVNMARMALGGPAFGVRTSAAVVIGPPVLSRMLANRYWAHLLSFGMKLPRSSPAAATLAIRIEEVVRKIKKEIAAEKQIESPTLEELRGFGGRGF